MKPLINLKSFLAVLLILIVPAALLAAYFRNYSAEAGGHEHSVTAKSGGAAMGKGEMSGMKPGSKGETATEHGGMASGDKSAMKQGGDNNAAMEHGNMAMPEGGQMQPQQRGNLSQPPAAQTQKESGHAGMGHENSSQSSTAQVQPQQAQATSQPGKAAAVAASAPTGAGIPRSMKPKSSIGAGAEPAGMEAMGRVKDLTESGKGAEVASRLFHAGAKDFFLDHAQHLALNAEQQKKLNQIKEQALLGKASANRRIQEAEQQLWKSTASDQPNLAEIETKVREIEKLRAGQRLATIHSVGEAAKTLTDEQTKILLGTAASAMSDAKPATPGRMPTPKSDHQHKP